MSDLMAHSSSTFNISMEAKYNMVLSMLRIVGLTEFEQDRRGSIVFQFSGMWTKIQGDRATIVADFPVSISGNPH